MMNCGRCPKQKGNHIQKPKSTLLSVPKSKNLADHDPKECGHRLKGRLIHRKDISPTESKETVKVYDIDKVREMAVPERNPTDLAGIWPRSELIRLQKQSKVMTLEDKRAMIEEMERKKQEEIQASEMRKEALAKAQIHQDLKLGSKIANVELEAQKKNEYLLERSHQLLNEQDDRVKVANCIILATKCRAIRNAQIKEKELIKKQLQQEERRLDDMMEQARQKALKQDEKKSEIEESKLKRYGKEIKEQIKENEIHRLLEAERIEEESRMLNRALIAMRKEDEEKIRQLKENQKMVREELHQANLDLEKYRQMQLEEQRIADLRIQEFMRQKAAREEAREAELSLIKTAKEKEIARLRAQQQKAQDKQALMDEMQAIRTQEEVEREWREKEKRAAIKKAEDMKALHEARSKQIADIRAAKSMNIARDEAAFHKVAKVQREQYEKDQKEKAQKKEINFKHRKEILKQINEKERERINLMKERFEDGKGFRLSQELRDTQISEYIKCKVGKLRQEALPEPYIADIERQLKLRE